VARLSAIEPGTDLSRHARDLAQIHDAILGGGRPVMQPRALVARSWARVMRLGLNPHGNSRQPLPRAELERRRHESPLNVIIDELRQILCGVADATPLIVVVTDADGVILWREGSTRVSLRADGLGFSEGTVWTEPHVGTNAIGTALAEAAPVQLFSAEHYEEKQHAWYCTACPIHDPRTGEILGVVDVSGPALSLHPALTALVDTAVRLGESRLWHHHQVSLERLRRSAEPVLAAVHGPLLLVDDHGWVAHHHGIAVRGRIAAPRADRALAVPGLGLCMPQRLGNGWLVRPTAPAHAIIARLDLTNRPVLELRTEGEPWITSLTRRHAELLARLALAGPTGLSAGQLSAALFGDVEHAVTIRAEISRLRRVIGALVDTNPYRLAEGVALTVVGRADN